MDFESWRELLSTPENQWFDRKSFKIDKRKLAQSLVAFANTEGGTIALGIQDRVATGMPTAQQVNSFQQAAFDFTDPTVKIRMETVAALTPSGDPAEIRLIHVEQSPHVHLMKDGSCWVRHGDQTQQLPPNEVTELRYTKGDQQFDRTPVPHATMEDIDQELLSEYADVIGAADAASAVNARGLADRNGTPSVAAILLFGKHPQSFFPQARVRVLKWSTNERTSGQRQTLEHDSQYEGTLPHQIFAARKTIQTLLPQTKRLGSDGLFVTESQIPSDAWLEALVNAVVHRAYSMIGDHIRFEIFPNRIEVTSPGRFPGVADPSRPETIPRFARNPIIARAAAELSIGQELGEGIRRIFTEMRSIGFQDPVYEQTAGNVTLTLPAQRRVSDDLRARLPAHSERILTYLRNSDRPLGTSEIAEGIGKSGPVARKALQALRKAGLVHWEGKSPQDPRATWSVPNVL